VGYKPNLNQLDGVSGVSVKQQPYENCTIKSPVTLEIPTQRFDIVNERHF